MPKRIQRKRTKGWRAPPGSMYVGRPTKWGNPFVGDRSAAAKAFRLWIDGMDDSYPVRRATILTDIDELRGKDLACWCPDGAECHADVLIEYANQPQA